MTDQNVWNWCADRWNSKLEVKMSKTVWDSERIAQKIKDVGGIDESVMSEEEAQLLKMRAGTHGYEPHSVEHCAAALRMTASYASAVQSKALLKLCETSELVRDVKERDTFRAKGQFNSGAYIEAAERLYLALETLYTGLVDAGENIRAETGEEYHDCAVAREVLDECRGLFE
jgi:hypothetical protein